jgi:hypothetical protein
MQVPISQTHVTYYILLLWHVFAILKSTVVYGFRRLKMSETLMENYKN